MKHARNGKENRKENFNSSSESEIERISGNIFDSNPIRKQEIAYVSIEFEYRIAIMQKTVGSIKKKQGIFINRRYNGIRDVTQLCHRRSINSWADLRYEIPHEQFLFRAPSQILHPTWMNYRSILSRSLLFDLRKLKERCFQMNDFQSKGLI